MCETRSSELTVGIAWSQPVRSIWPQKISVIKWVRGELLFWMKLFRWKPLGVLSFSLEKEARSVFSKQKERPPKDLPRSTRRSAGSRTEARPPESYYQEHIMNGRRTGKLVEFHLGSCRNWARLVIREITNADGDHTQDGPEPGEGPSASSAEVQRFPWLSLD